MNNTMNIVADGLYAELQKLAASGYSGMTIDSWREGKIVRVTPIFKITLEQASKLHQAGVLTDVVEA